MASINELQDGPEKEALVKQFGGDADVMEVAKGFLNAREKLSSTRRVAGPDASPEDRSKMYDYLGRPESADKYVLPEGPESLRPTLESLRNVAYDKGLTQDQFQALAIQAGAVSAEADTKLRDAKKAWEAKVREKHGDSADTKLAAAQHQFDQILASDPEAGAVIKQFGLDKHPAIVDLLLKVNNAVNDDSTPGAGISPPADTSGPTPEALYKEGMEVMRSEAYKKGSRHPENSLAAGRVTEILIQLQNMGFKKGFMDDRFKSSPMITMPDGTKVRYGR